MTQDFDQNTQAMTRSEPVYGFVPDACRMSCESRSNDFIYFITMTNADKTNIVNLGFQNDFRNPALFIITHSVLEPETNHKNKSEIQFDAKSARPTLSKHYIYDENNEILEKDIIEYQNGQPIKELKSGFLVAPNRQILLPFIHQELGKQNTLRDEDKFCMDQFLKKNIAAVHNQSNQPRP